MLHKLRLIGSWFFGAAIICFLILGETFVIRARARRQYKTETDE